MGHRNPNRQRRVAAAAAVALAVALATMGTGAFAQSARGRGGAARYQAHAAVPEGSGPARPGTAKHRISRARAARGAAEPQSAAAAKRGLGHLQSGLAQGSRCAAAQGRGREEKAAQRTAAETMEAEGRPLSRAELDRGAGRPGSSVGGSQTPDESARPMRPSELGSKSFFSGIFSSFSDKEETGTFTGEPARENLTAPPAGYQTPSPAQPYGLGPKTVKAKAATVEDRASGVTR